VNGSPERTPDGRARGPLAPRIVAQVRELHENVVVLSQQAGGFASRQGRRELKEARQSESDLLRVLGFDSYDEFERAVSTVGVDDEAVVIVLDDVPGQGQRAGRLTPDDAAPSEIEARAARAGDLDGFRVRVGAFEEELAEVRFELMRMRDELVGMRERLTAAESRPASSDRASEDSAAERLAAKLETTFGDLARSLAATAAELSALFGHLQRERAELTSAAEQVRSEGARVVQAALADAEQARADAAAHAREMLDDARSQATAITRDAMVTLEGLRRLHDADGDGGILGDAPS
jgi:hypothetical protein